MLREPLILAGLFPILVGTGTGSEGMSRIAAPMIGAMLTAPLLSMLVIPAAYLLLRRRGAARSFKNQTEGEPQTKTPMANTAEATVSGRGTGTVTAIDMAAGKVTLDYAPICEANWPAMTMGVEAAPDMLDKFAVGDKVEFEMTTSQGAAKITSIRLQ